MKKQFFNPWIIGIMIAGVICVSSCSDDDDDDPQVMEKTYTLGPIADPAISGTVTFTKQDENTTKVTIDLAGTQAGGNHPAHIHANSAAEDGPIVIDLNNVDGATGRSETLVTELNDGTPIDYEGMINFDGHVNVHLSPTELGTRIAQGDIGSNSQ